MHAFEFYVTNRLIRYFDPNWRLTISDTLDTSLGASESENEVIATFFFTIATT